MKTTRATPLLVESGKNKSKQVDINKLYLYFRDMATKTHIAFDYTGLRLWLRDFIKSVITNDNPSMTVNSDSKLLIPSKTWVKGIRLKGSATGIIMVFNGKTYPTISSAVNGHEIIPQKHCVESDIYLTVSATSWGELEIIVYT